MAGLTKGIVIDVNDPAGFHRVKVRIPELDGGMSDNLFSVTNRLNKSRVEDEHLLWCEVCYPYDSNLPPEPNQVVLVGFFNGDTKTPVVLGWLGYEYAEEEQPFVKK